MKKILILLFLVFFQFGYSQTRNLNKEIDSLLLKGRYQLALKKLKSLEPTYTSYAKIANIYYQVDKTKLAIVYYKKSLDLDSVYSTKVQLGKAYQKVKKYDEAISIYKDIVEKDSLNLLLKYQLGKIYLIKRKATLAVETFQELYDLDATNANYSYQKGIGYAMKKQRNKMIGSFLEAYKTDSTHMKSINQLATSFAKLGDKDSTFLFINKGLSLEPNHFSLNKTKINQLYKEEKYDEVLPVLIRLDTVYRNRVSVIDMLGRVYFSMGDFEKSKKEFERSIKIERRNFKTHTYLGHVAMKMENYKQASMSYMMAVVFATEKLDEEYYGLGYVNLKLKKPKKAISMFDKAYKANRDNHKALYQLAKTSDDFYIEKKQVYKYFREYLLYFDEVDKDLTAYAQKRVKEIKKDYFLLGKKIE